MKNSLAKFETASERFFFAKKCAFSFFLWLVLRFFERGKFWCKPWLDTLLKCELVIERQGLMVSIHGQRIHTNGGCEFLACHAIDYWPHLSVLLRPQYLSSYRSRKRGSIKLFVKTPPRNWFVSTKFASKQRKDSTQWCQIVHMGGIKASWVFLVKPQPE